MDRALAKFVEPDAVQGPPIVLARRRRLLAEGAQPRLCVIAKRAECQGYGQRLEAAVFGEVICRVEQAMANLFPDLADHAQSGSPIALVPLRVQHRTQPLAAIPDIEPDLTVVLGYTAGG